MIIKDITIRNFRSYYGENIITFSEGLTLLIGDNGDGKTTFFEALQWLFNTTTEDIGLTNFSEMRRSQMEIGEEEKISVSMTFEHNGEKSVEKSFIVKRTSDRFTTTNFIFKGYETTSAGRVQVSGKLLLDRCFDAFMQKFSMFKGESNLNVFDDETALKQLVEKFSDLKSFEKFVEETAEFADKSYKAYTSECKRDDKIAKEARRIEADLEDVVSKILYTKGEIREKEAAANNYQKRIEVLEKNQDLNERYHEIKDRLKAKTEQCSRLRGQIASINFNTAILDRLWILCAFPPILKEFQAKCSALSQIKRTQNDEFIKEQGKAEGKLEAVKEIQKLANGTSRLPWYLPNEETMEEMIHDHICKVCGREAPEGSEAYKFMCEKLEEYRKGALEKVQQQQSKAKKPKKLFTEDYVEELHELSINLSGYSAREIAEIATKVKDQIELVQRLKAELKERTKELEEIKDEKDRLLVQSNGASEDTFEKEYSDLKGFFQYKHKAEVELVGLRRDLENYEARRDELKQQLSQLSPDKGQINVYKKVHTAFDLIHKAFKGAKEVHFTRFLESLEDKANEYLSALNATDFHGIVRLDKTANDSARIKLFSSNKTEIKKPSGSQQTTMYMSVLFAISDLATLKRKESYPLIFDAATSSFGDSKESGFYNEIGKLDKQCIIVTKDFITGSEIRMDDIKKLTCTVYRIRKAPSFDPNDLSTIRTTISKVQ